MRREGGFSCEIHRRKKDCTLWGFEGKNKNRAQLSKNLREEQNHGTFGEIFLC